MITPTVGRQVWYWKDTPVIGYQPEAATVCYVHNVTMVNLQVIDHAGVARTVMGVRLHQGDEPGVGMHCAWMPYQKGQARAQLDHQAGISVTIGPKDPPPDVAERRSKLADELRAVLNRASIENLSDTPDFILASYLTACLDAYSLAVKARDKWFGFEPWTQTRQPAAPTRQDER